MMTPKHLRVESDGDRIPKDVYLVDADGGMRVATIEGTAMSEYQKFKLARRLRDAFNLESDLAKEPSVDLRSPPSSCKCGCKCDACEAARKAFEEWERYET